MTKRFYIVCLVIYDNEILGVCSDVQAIPPQLHLPLACAIGDSKKREVKNKMNADAVMSIAHPD